FPREGRMHRIRPPCAHGDPPAIRHLKRMPEAEGGTMAAYFDDREQRSPEEREKDLFARLPAFLASSMRDVPGLARWLEGLDPATLTSRSALASLPVLRKAEL